MGPIIIESIKAINLSENNDFELCMVYEAAKDCEVKWYQNNHLLEPTDNCIIETKNGKSTIKIRYVDKKKVGKYEAVIQSNGKIVKTAGSVKLIKPTDELEIMPPVFIRPVRSKEAYLGDIVLIESEVISSPSASFQWFLDTREVTSYTKEHKLNHIYVTTKDNISCLCIEKITSDLAGIVTCRAENFAGSVSSSATLTLREKEPYEHGGAPVFTKPLQPTIVMDGEPIVLSCEVLGQPWPKIEWSHNGNVIQKARDIAFARQESGLCELLIKEAFPEMEGYYSCTATNDFGSSNSECVLTVEGSDGQLS